MEYIERMEKGMRIKFIDVIKSSNENVKKYIYGDDTAIVESVIYKYPDYETRTTICISVQCGCKVGCVFCGTGKKFIRNLTCDEIVLQVTETFKMENINTNNVEKLQIMFMSMGEPTHNMPEVINAMDKLNNLYHNCELLVSSIGRKEIYGVINYAELNDNVGLQFSIHHFDDNERDKIIPFDDKMSLEDISKCGIEFFIATGRKAFCNYVVTPNNNKGYERLFELFPKEYFNFTFSVLCSPDESIKSAFINNKDSITEIHSDFYNRGYNVRLFDPAGQDDIGGGCGQLWYFQKFIDDKGGQ
jgi:23S rRNA (adenine2503-C2)-methyltransferase